MLRSTSSWQDASGLEQREKGLAGGSRGVAMNAPSSLAWMLSEILHGRPAFPRTHFLLDLISSNGFRQPRISIDYSSFWAFCTRAPEEAPGPGSVILYTPRRSFAGSLLRTLFSKPGSFRANAVFLLVWRICRQ